MIDAPNPEKIRDIAWKLRKNADVRAQQLSSLAQSLDRPDGKQVPSQVRDQFMDAIADLAEQVYALSQKG